MIPTSAVGKKSLPITSDSTAVTAISAVKQQTMNLRCRKAAAQEAAGRAASDVTVRATSSPSLDRWIRKVLCTACTISRAAIWHRRGGLAGHSHFITREGAALGRAPGAAPV